VTEDDEMASAEIGFAIKNELEAMLKTLPKTALEWDRVPHWCDLEELHWDLGQLARRLAFLLREKV
jgi:hypothetical protein